MDGRVFSIRRLESVNFKLKLNGRESERSSLVNGLRKWAVCSNRRPESQKWDVLRTQTGRYLGINVNGLEEMKVDGLE